MIRRRSLPLLLLLAGCTRPSGQDETAAIERMIEQRRADPFEATDLFPDGAVMQTPPRGSVPADPLPRALAATTSPPRLHDVGRTTFAIHCAACHGPDGLGRSIVARNMTGTPPPSLLDDRVRALEDSALLNRIVHGLRRMPSYAPQLGPAERLAVVDYVRRLQAGEFR